MRASWNGVNGMRQSSIIIHKGKKEEKYEIYVEDYVISFLKEKADTSRASEILFYGRREKGGRQYTIYGAGQDRHLTVFDKYDLLEEISCRLTQTEPAFFVKEADGTYEVKGYKVFYYENEVMQDYLIHRNTEKNKNSSFRDADGQGVPYRRMAQIGGQPVKERNFYAISLQLGLVFVVLVAIVINSSNSYDKMKQLNQSAEEVFFVIENQEAEERAVTEIGGGPNDIVVERDATQDNILQNSVLQENALHEQEAESDGLTADLAAGQEQTNANSAGTIEESDEKSTEVQAEASQQEPETIGENDDGVEALSRNVARYYEVERGDTLYMISQKIYGDTSHVKKICEINQISDPDNIRYGQKIILP